MKYKNLVSVLKYNFQVSILYLSIFFPNNFFFHSLHILDKYLYFLLITLSIQAH